MSPHPPIPDAIAPTLYWRATLVALLCFSVLPALSQTPTRHVLPRTVPQCSDVTMQASFLVEEKPAQGSGFLVTIHNDRPQAIAIRQPTPLGIHWYAVSGSRLTWRASSGSGGSLVNALRPDGPLFATEQEDPAATQSVTIPAHATYSWSIFSAQAPALRFRPGCEHCNYQGEEQFRAVLAYAYLPGSQQGDSSLLRCGLRSKPVIMPPLPESHLLNNSHRP